MPKNIVDVINDTFDITNRPGEDVEVIEIPDFITGGELEINKGADTNDNEDLDLSGLKKNNKVEPKSDPTTLMREYVDSLDALSDSFNEGAEGNIVEGPDPELPEQVWQENILNNFDNPTYHLTLYVGTKTDIQIDEYKERGVIVAETGSTSRFHIDNLEVASPVGGSEIVSTVAPQITFQVTEPNGAGFFPAAITATKQLGIPQFIKAGFALEVRFKGRNKSTGQPTNIGGGVWVYKLVVLDIQTKHGVDGSTYFFTTRATSQVANQQEFATVKEEITLRNIGTLGEALKELETKLTRYHRNLAITKRSQTEDIIKIKYPAEWSKWEMIVVDAVESTDKQKVTNTVLESGTLIKHFIGTLIYYTKQFAERLKDAGAHIDNDDKFQVKDYLGKYYKIKTDVEFKDQFDEARQDYPKIITYEIIEVLERIQVKEKRLQDVLDDKKKQEATIAEMIRKRLLNKRYDYLNTGLNTEVLQFEATLDQSHIVPEAIYQGSTSYPVNTVAKSSEAVQKSDKLNPNAPFQQIVEAERQAKINVQDARRNVADAEARMDQGQRVSIDEYASLKQAEIVAVEERDKISAIRQQRVKRDFTSADYLGDIVVSSENFLRERYLPVKTKRNTTTDLSAMLTLVRERQMITKHLLNIELGIKGDPYWLGEPSFYEDTRGGAQLHEDSTFPYDSGPPFFLFSMFFPTNYDGNGQSRPLFNALYSGVYQTFTVIHSMRGGQYNIFMTAKRDTQIQEEVVKQMVENLKFKLPDSKDKPTITEQDGKDEQPKTSDGATDLGTGPPVSEDLYERQKRAVDVLMEEGLTRDQAIGMVANLTAESALRTDAINRNDGGPGKHSEGLAQWNRNRLDNLKNFAGVPVNTATSDIPFDTQLRYIAHEFKGSGGNGGGSEGAAWNKMQSANNLQEATIAGNYYERFKDYTDPPSSTNEVGHRIKIANELVNRLNNEQDPKNKGIN